MNLFVKVSHGRFHDILPKEYSGTFPELLWGKMICYKLRCLLTMRVSQILSLTRLIPEIKSIYIMPNGFFTTLMQNCTLKMDVYIIYYLSRLSKLLFSSSDLQLDSDSNLNKIPLEVRNYQNLSNSKAFVKINYSNKRNLFLVGWHVSALSLTPGDIIFAQLACPRIASLLFPSLKFLT
jgi:hypothetical protein